MNHNQLLYTSCDAIPKATDTSKHASLFTNMFTILTAKKWWRECSSLTEPNYLSSRKAMKEKSTQVEVVNGIKILLTHSEKCRPAECEISMMQVPSEYSKTGKIAQKS